MDRIIDFDAYLAGQPPAVPVLLRWRGREWALPADLPAAVALSVASQAKAAGGTLPDHAVEGLARGVFGAVLDELLEMGIGVRDLAALLTAVMAEYTAGPEPKAEQAPTSAPAAAAVEGI